MFDYTCKKCASPFRSPKRGKQYCSHRCFASRFDPVTKRCETCGKDFTVAYRFRGQKTCGLECAKTAIARTLTTREVKKCLACGDEFSVVQSRKDDAGYCCYDPCFLSSRKTRQPDVTKACERCKRDFTVPFTDSAQRFCGYSCANSGENNGMFGKPGPMTGKQAWSRGLTKQTDPRLRVLGEKISAIVADKMVSGSWSPPSTGFKGEHYTGTKNGGAIVYLRSSYESTYARMLDADPTVVSWQHEPLRIPYLFEGSVHNYVPDFMVTTDEGPVLVEVKPSLLSDTVQNLAKMRAAQAWCDTNDVAYALVTEANLTDTYPGASLNQEEDPC